MTCANLPRAIQVMAGCALAGSALLAADRMVTLDVGGEDLATILIQVAREGDIEIFFLPEYVEGRAAPPLAGEYEPRQAIELLLFGSGMAVRETQRGALVIEPKAVVDGRAEAAAAAGSPPNQPSRGLAAAIAALFSGSSEQSPPAQQANGQQWAARPVEEIQVTGSRIERTGMTTPVPVTSMSQEELSDMDPGSLIESLQQLPQFLGSSTAQQRGTFLGPAGQSLLNIRGMGQNRALVLLDGRRIVPGDRLSSVDISLFPEAMIRRVEVVTGGASAAYGADAVAGVVNFIVDREYSGLESRVQGGMTRFGDGENWSAMLAGGFPLGSRGHVIFSGETFNMREVQGRIAGLDHRGTGRVEDGGWFHRWGWVTNPAWQAAVDDGECRPRVPCPAGPQRLTVPEVHSTLYSPGGVINQPGFAYHRHTFLEDGQTTREFILSPTSAPHGTLSQSGGAEYWAAHLGQREELTSRNKRRNAFVSVDYELNASSTVFLQGILGRMESHFPRRQGSQGPSLMGIWHHTVFADNAFLPEHIRQAMIDDGIESFRMDKGGWIIGRNNYGDRYRDGTVASQASLTTGLRTALSNGWTVDAYYQYGTTRQTMLLTDALRLDRFFMAADAVVDPQTGGIVCNVHRYRPTLEQLADSVAGVLVQTREGRGSIASPVGLDGSIERCVPLNVFGHGNVSPEAAAYVTSDKWAISQVRQHFVEVLASGEVYQGSRVGPVGLAAGVTFRHETMGQTAYPREVDALGPPQNAPAIGIRGIPPGFSGGSPSLHQFSTLTTFGGSFDVWEAFGELAVPLYSAPGGGPRIDLALAGRYAGYSRAGGVWTWKAGLDLQLTNDVRLRGTLSGDAREATFAELFDYLGGGGSVTDPVFGNESYSITSVQGGNPDLGLEEADTVTFGLVYMPSWLRGLQFSADYYDVDLKGAIGQLGLQRIVDECHSAAQRFCAQIARDPATNIITRVENRYLNVNRARVNGIDFELSYRMQPNFIADLPESLSFRALAGHLRENSTTPLGGSKLNVAGSEATPDWTSVASLNYAAGPWRVFVQHRWVNRLTRDINWVEGVDVDNNRVASATYVNTRLSYRFDTPAGDWELYTNVSNVFDRTPPLYAVNVARGIPGGTGIASLHDQLGRRFVAGVHFRY